MKKLMTMVLAIIPLGILAQSEQVDYAFNDNSFTMSDAEMENPVKEEATSDFDFEVSDMLLVDPDFDIQENMVSFTKDGNTVYFSANKKLKIKNNTASAAKVKNSVQLHLFRADVVAEGEWANLEMLAFNSPRHSTGHPSLNHDDSKLFFVADGPESMGKTDLFMVELEKDGSYGKPMNLGEKINSAEREVYPYVDAESNLYFASDAENSGESLDVYASSVIGSEPSAPIKLDVDVNSSKEELIAAFKAVDEETIRAAEAAAELRDLEILLEAERLAEIEMVEKELVSSLSGKAYDFSSDQMVYTVQIGAFLENVKTGTYKEYSGLFNHQYEDGYNRFYSGVFLTEKEAEAHLKQMMEKGFNDAFVLGLQGESRHLVE